MRLLAIDFGTSNTVAALLVDGQAARTVTFDTSPLLPSAVFLGEDGRLTVGRDAQRLARLDPTRFEPNPKRRIDDGEVLLGDRVIPVAEMISAVLAAVALEVRRQLGGTAPDEVRLTHPAQWGATRRHVLAGAARAAGLGDHLVLLPEPVAAAAQFTRLPGRALAPGAAVAVYDLGGGTLDVAVVGRTGPAAPAAAAEAGDGFVVLAAAGLADLGGLDFDSAILDQIGRIASAGHPARWQQILRPRDAGDRRAARALAEDVRAAKETLSRYPQTDVSLPEPFVDAHLTRTEFEGLIRPNLLRSIDVLSGTLRAAGVAPDQLGGIFLVGGSSRVPLVAALIQERLLVTPVALDQPETAVALGALLVPINRSGSSRTPAIGPARPLPERPLSHRPLSHRPLSHRPSRRGRHRGIIAAAAVLVAAGLVLLLVRPFGAAPAAAPSAAPATVPVPTRSTAAATTVVPRSTARRSGSAGTSGRTTASTPGFGPGRVFTAGEVAFLAHNVSRLTDCTDFTRTFDQAVPSALHATRSVRCAVGTDDTGNLGRPVLLYVVTAADPGAADNYLTALVKARRRHSSGLAGGDSDTAFSASALAGRVITAYDLPALGRSELDPAQGASVLAWAVDGRPYVGLVVSLGTSIQSELTDFWAQNYRPRG